MTITEATEEVTQATEKIFIHGMPITYTPDDGLHYLAIYDEIFSTLYDKHTITLAADGASLVVQGSNIKPNRSLTDEEMVSYLTEQLLESSNKVEQLRNTIVLLEQDAETISTYLLQEATNRGWCQDYNNFCETVNSKLSLSALEPSESEYEVSGKLTATASVGDTQVTVECDFTVTVTATSQDHADSIVNDDPQAFFDPEHEAVSAIRAGWDSYDVELN